jgi:hypothetical protein
MLKWILEKGMLLGIAHDKIQRWEFVITAMNLQVLKQHGFYYATE